MLRKLIIMICVLPPCAMMGQGWSSATWETHFARPLGAVLNDIADHFGITLKYNVDTAGLCLPYADFRLRPYSADESLNNALRYFDYYADKQDSVTYKIKSYDYPRRKPEDGMKLIPYLSSLYSGREEWESRRAILRREARSLIGIDSLLSKSSKERPVTGRKRKYDGYSVQNFSMKTIGSHTVKGSVYAPLKGGRHPLIICPVGHFKNGRYGEVQQLRLGTLARMGAVCVDYDMWGWGESEDEVGAAAHQTAEAEVMQILAGLRLLDWAITRGDVDTTRVAANGGSGGGTHVMLLTLLDDRFTASCPVVSLSSWFDGGCPCESGKGQALAGGGTCNVELAATFAPKPMMVVSDGGDWTRTTPVLEYPFLQRIYGFYGAADKVRNIHYPADHHDFNENKRNAVYRFFIDVFGLDESKLDESRVTIESEDDLRFNKRKVRQ